MNLEQLTKTQIILLTLLVSFVTSIATGIVTVSLVDQAPPAVTQTINRVVERTVERVVSDEEGEGQEIVTREVQVVVKENDLIPTAVAKVEKSLVRLYTYNSAAEDTKGTFLGLGFFVLERGVVVTDASLIAPETTYVVEMANRKTHTARLTHEDSVHPTALLDVTFTEDVEVSEASRANLSTVQLGQTILTISGKERNKVSIGIISDIVFETGGEQDSGKITTLVSSIPDETVFFGAPLVDVFGSVIGIYTAASGGTSGAAYTPVAVVEKQLSEVLGIVQ